jgi:adenylylsulfate kinase
MIEKLLPAKYHNTEILRRSLLKTITYRLVIITLDFVCVYLFSGKVKVALGFTIVSNIYTTIIYYFHERMWDRIKWGKTNLTEASKKI